jgi:D-alanyl-D-alanine dipeptidase
MPVITSNKPSLDLQSNTLSPSLPERFIYLSEICPTILQDIKYASDDNFTGKVIEGYNKAVAILTKDTATMLQNAQRELEQQGLSFLIWDAYRPIRAVNFFLKWRTTEDNPVIKKKYYPSFSKDEIFLNGFISPGKSSHSRGSTVDLTIIDKKTNLPLDLSYSQKLCMEIE